MEIDLMTDIPLTYYPLMKVGEQFPIVVGPGMICGASCGRAALLPHLEGWTLKTKKLSVLKIVVVLHSWQLQHYPNKKELLAFF
jgi:hypothetical protein